MLKRGQFYDTKDNSLLLVWGKSFTKKYRYYIATWKKYCPNYQIHEWNETNFDVDQNLYCKEAYKAKKWAFVSDYARLKIIL